MHGLLFLVSRALKDWPMCPAQLCVCGPPGPLPWPVNDIIGAACDTEQVRHWKGGGGGST